ncbi:MOSC domain-containing protein [Pseudomonas sp.]|uniref:MOSC domain-containing protein n=1 Tax=Pseudomonas sp. TaxID=306 RepID=UPI0028A6F143|nr:MOSC domain-containing protein [Pseudomonas sp.]
MPAMQLSALYRFPLKSAIGEALSASPVDSLGLHGDRRWLAVDASNGRFLTQRLLPQMTQLLARYAADDSLILSAPGLGEIHVAVPGVDAELRGVTVWSDTLRVPDAGDDAAAWLSQLLGRACRLVYLPVERARPVNAGYGETDDRVAFADGFPLLLIGQASLEDLSARVGRPLEMLRFRPNLVVEGSAAYAEDDWKRIRIGGLDFRVAKGCSRCIMTTLDPRSGERTTDREPLTTLKTYRERDGEVYFGQNLICDGRGVLEVGMPVEILE